MNLLDLASECQCHSFILISSDKGRESVQRNGRNQAYW